MTQNFRALRLKAGFFTDVTKDRFTTVNVTDFAN